MRRSPGLGTILTFAVALGFGPAVTHASGFSLLEQSASRLGTAFAGTAAAADDATTIYFNAAGLVELSRPEATVVASGVGIQSEFHDRQSQPAFGQRLGGEGGDAGGWNFVPSAYFAAPVGDVFTVGLGINAPFGLALEYEPGWLGRFQALDSEITTLNINPSVAFRVTDRLSIGVGLNYQTVDAELTNAVNYSAVVAQGVQQLVAQGQLPAAAAPGVNAANLGLEGGARVRGDDSGWGINAGVLIDLTDTTRVGLAYRSGVTYEIEGNVRFTPPAVANPIGASIVAAASGPGGPLRDGAASVDLELPDTVQLSLRQKIGDRFELLADVGWTGWSSIQEIRVVRDDGEVVSDTPAEWNDVARYALGGTWQVAPSLKLRAGIAYDGTEVPDRTRTPRLPDPTRQWLAVGARWQPTESLVADFGYAHLFADDAPLDQDIGNAAAYGLVNGHQASAIDIVGVQFAVRF